MKTPSQISKLIILTALTGSMMACGNGFNAASDGPISEANLAASTGNGAGSVMDPATGNTIFSEKAWGEVARAIDGEVEGGTNSGALVIQVDKARQSLVLQLPLPPIFNLAISAMAIPELPGASVEMVVQSDGSRVASVVIPLKYVIKGAMFSDYGKLPNGDAIPYIPAGEAKGFAISFPQRPKYRMHIYLAVNAAAVFVETPEWNLPDQFASVPTIGFPVKNHNKTQINGYFAVVPNRSEFSGGVYVASRIPPKLAIMIDELVRF